MSTIDQRFAVASLLGYCEGLVKSGLLGEHIEWQMRCRIAEALVAFNMPSQSECDAIPLTAEGEIHVEMAQ